MYSLRANRSGSNHCWMLLAGVIVALISPSNTKTFFHQNRPTSNADLGSTTDITPIAAPTTPAVETTRDIIIGPCIWVIGRKCPDKDIKFYLYTRHNMMDRQCLHIDETLDKSNLTASFFDPHNPTKIIVHGYNSDMFLSPLHKMREEYLAKGEYNIIYADWSILSPGPCYISAVHNTRHTGACIAQLVERILDYGSADIHVIGFSLGAQVTNYIARNLGSFLLPRITGLDPALPLFITAPASDKLDASDAAYVDVFHTNALVQGKLERCGHADFYMNGGIMQPGCTTQASNPFACSHQRAPAYFLESIRSRKGFWGWACSSYISYLLGMCPPTNYLLEAGENIKRTTKGMFLVTTNDTSPYALGKWTDLPTLGAKRPTVGPILVLKPPAQTGDPLLRQVDQWGKLDSSFNNLEDFPSPDYEANGNYWTYFNNGDSSDIANEFKDDNSVEEQQLENEENDAVDWREYRKNLTKGVIENTLFQMPKIRG